MRGSIDLIFFWWSYKGMQTESGLRTDVLVLLVAMKARQSYMLPWSHVASFNWHRRGHNESPWVVSSGFMEPWIELKHQEARIVCWNGSNDDWHSKLRYYISGAARGVHMFMCKVYSGLLDLLLLELGRCRCMCDMSNCYISLQLPFQRPRNRTPCFSKVIFWSGDRLQSQPLPKFIHVWSSMLFHHVVVFVTFDVVTK